jgi:hypothetical protein
MNSEKISSALDSARRKAEYLSRKGIIIGAFIALENVFVNSEGMRPYISSVK